MKLSQDLKSFKLYLYGEKKINEHRIFSCVDLALYYIGQEWELSKFDLQINPAICDLYFSSTLLNESGKPPSLPCPWRCRVGGGIQKDIHTAGSAI